jgi:hypothetical protein
MENAGKFETVPLVIAPTDNKPEWEKEVGNTD